MTEAEQRVIDAIAEVLPIPTEPFPLGWEDDTEWEVRRFQASSWVNVGLTDSVEVRRWTEAGVHSAGVAGEARRMGYRPEDPWVEKSSSSYTSPDGQAVEEPGRFAAWRNRRQALSEWKAAETKRLLTEGAGRRKAENMAALMRRTAFDDGFGLATLDLLYSIGGEVRDVDVIRGFNELVTHIDAMKTQHDRDGHLDEDTAGNVPHFLVMLGVVEQTLSACTPEEQQTMTTQLDTAKAWLQSVETS